LLPSLALHLRPRGAGRRVPCGDMAPKKKEKEVEKEEEPVEEAVEEPPPPPEPTEDELRELSTGLALPLRGLDVAQVWTLGEDWAQQERLLVPLLGLEEAWPSVSQRSLVCEFYIFNLQQAKALCLTPLQGAVFHAIMHEVLTLLRCPDMQGRRGSQDMPCGAEACFQQFQQLLVQHAVSRPPEQLGIFRLSDAKMLTDFASATLFKHFLLYQFCVNVEQEVQTLRVCRPLQRPLRIPDLSGARLKPRVAEDKGSAGGGQADSQKAEEANVGGPSPLGDEATGTEEDEVERLVAEKLKETEAALQKKLDERQEAFELKLADKAAKGQGAKGAKKK